MPTYSETNAGLKKRLADQAGVNPKDLDDKTVKAVNSGLRGGAVVAQRGADPRSMSIDELKSADPAGAPKEKANEEEKTKQQKILMALAAALPTIAGAAFGGLSGVGAAAGGSIGAQAGAQGVAGITGGIAEEKKAEAVKKEKAITHGMEAKKLDLAERELKQKGELAKLEAGSKRGTAVAGSEAELRKEYLGNPMTKRTQEVSESFGRMQQVAQNPSAAGDISMIFSFMRMNDPASTVREGEFATAQNAGGVPDRIRAAYNRALEGERLAPAQRTDFLNQGAALAQSQLQKQEAFAQNFSQLATRIGADPQNVIVGFGQPTSQQAQAMNQSGTKGRGGFSLPGPREALAAPMVPSDEQLDAMSDDELRKYLGKGKK